MDGIVKVTGEAVDFAEVGSFAGIRSVVAFDEDAGSSAGLEDDVDVIRDRLGHQERLQQQRFHISEKHTFWQIGMNWGCTLHDVWLLS